MAINITSDYALRTILYLSNEAGREKISGKEICDEMKIPYNYFLKIVPLLKDAGFVSSFQGKKGGYTLLKRPEEISVYDILVAMSDPIIVSHCLLDNSICSRRAAGHCTMHALFGTIQTYIDQEMKRATMAEVLKNGLPVSF